jgi:hypothetical protein
VAHAQVVIPVPEAEPLLREDNRDPQGLGTGDAIAAAVPHVLLLGRLRSHGPGPVGRRTEDPLEGLEEELSGFFADVTPFEFTLTGVHRFPGGELYLAPGPAAPFRQLVRALHRRLDQGLDQDPGPGDFDESVPHVAVPVPPGEDDAAVESRLAPRLPLHCLARGAALLLVEQDGVRAVASFPFGTTAA